MFYDFLVTFALVAGGSDADSGTLNLIKVLRLSRLVRALRLVVQFRMLWQLLRGLFNTLELMTHTVTTFEYCSFRLFLEIS